MILKKYSKDRVLKTLKFYLLLWYERHSRTKHKFDIVDMWFVVVLCISGGALLFMVSEMSISYKEASRILSDPSLLYVWIRFLFDMFGINDYSLRGSFIFIHCCNMILLFMIGQLYLHRMSDSLFLVVIYALLPGVNLGAVLIGKSGFIIFMLLLICYIHLRYGGIPYVLIFLGGILDIAFSVVFVALGIYAIRKNKTKTLLASIVGFGINMFLYSNAISGVPKAYFLDSIGMFAVLFSPFLFIYFVYTLYAGIVRRQDKTLMIYIASSGIVLGLLLSMRQEIDIQSFAPLCVVGLPVMVYDFFSNIRVRLKMYRARFRIRIAVIISALCLQTFFLYGNKLTYLVSLKPNFASNHYIAKDLAAILKSKQITTIKVQDLQLALRLNFYGIQTNNGKMCLYSDLRYNGESIEVRYMGRVVKQFILVKDNACSI